MGFTAGKPSENLYKTERKCVKNQMTARNFLLVNVKPTSHSDVDFLPIYTGMRASLPAGDPIATAVTANNQAHKTDIEEVLIDFIKDWVKKLQDRKKKANCLLVNQGLGPAQVTLDPTFLPPGATDLWGSVMVIPNPGQLPQNPQVAIIPGAPLP